MRNIKVSLKLNKPKLIFRMILLRSFLTVELEGGVIIPSLPSELLGRSIHVVLT